MHCSCYVCRRTATLPQGLPFSTLLPPSPQPSRHQMRVLTTRRWMVSTPAETDLHQTAYRASLDSQEPGRQYYLLEKTGSGAEQSTRATSTGEIWPSSKLLSKTKAWEHRSGVDRRPARWETFSCELLSSRALYPRTRLPSRLEHPAARRLTFQRGSVNHRL